MFGCGTSVLAASEVRTDSPDIFFRTAHLTCTLERMDAVVIVNYSELRLQIEL